MSSFAFRIISIYRDNVARLTPLRLACSRIAGACRGGKGTPSLQGQLFATISIYDLNIVLRIKKSRIYVFRSIMGPIVVV